MVLATGASVAAGAGLVVHQHPRATGALLSVVLALLVVVLALLVFVLADRGRSRTGPDPDPDPDTLLETMDVGVIACDAQGLTCYTNPAMRRLRGLPATGDLPAAPFPGGHCLYAADGVTPVPHDAFAMIRALREGTSSGEFVLERHDGHRHHVIAQGTALHAPDGTVLGAVCVVHDITALAGQRAALEDSQARYLAEFDTAVAGKTHTAPDGRLIRANQALADMLGYSIEQLTTLDWPTITHPDDVAMSAEFFRRALAGEISGASFDKRYLHGDGRTVHVHVNSALVREADGSPAYFTTQMIDVTPRVQAERELREQRDLYSQLLQALSDLGESVTISENGRFVYANDAYCALTGFTLDQLRAMPDTMDMCPVEELPVWRTFMADRAGGGVVVPLRTAIRHRSGTTVPVEVATMAVPSAAGPRYVWVTRDISDRLRAESVDRLEAANDELRRANQFKDDVVAMLSHDLRQPLTSATGFCEIVLDGWDELADGERRGYIARAGQAALWANDLLEDVLTMARMDSDRPVPATATLDLAAAVARAVTRLGADAGKIDFGPDDAPPALTALADPAHLQQILANLLGNSVKYGSAPVSVLIRQVDDTVTIDVVDSGDGVPAEFVPHLFERFTRASGTAVAKKGSGLGLYIAHTLAEANSGTLTYRPGDQGGARFTLTLPATDRRRIPVQARGIPTPATR